MGNLFYKHMLLFNEQFDMTQISQLIYIFSTTSILHKLIHQWTWGQCGRDCMVVGLQLAVQSVLFTTKVAILNPVHGKVYLIQHYVIKVCQWLAKGWWFSPGTPASSIKKSHCHDITEILLKVVLNTINQTKPNHIL